MIEYHHTASYSLHNHADTKCEAEPYFERFEQKKPKYTQSPSKFMEPLTFTPPYILNRAPPMLLRPPVRFPIVLVPRNQLTRPPVWFPLNQLKYRSNLVFNRKSITTIIDRRCYWRHLAVVSVRHVIEGSLFLVTSVSRRRSIDESSGRRSNWRRLAFIARTAVSGWWVATGYRRARWSDRTAVPRVSSRRRHRRDTEIADRDWDVILAGGHRATITPRREYLLGRSAKIKQVLYCIYYTSSR